MPEPAASATAPSPRKRRRRVHSGFAAVALAMVVLLCSAACSPKSVLSYFGGGGSGSLGSVSSPSFHVFGSADITVSVSAPSSQAGIPITVTLSCAGGTTASATIVLSLQGGVALGQTTFHQGWPAGADCFVSQSIVKGVDAIPGALQFIAEGDQWVANFINQL